MQQRRTGVRNIIIGVVIVILVLGIGMFLTTRGPSNSATKVAVGGTPVAMQPVVVAQYPIPQGTTFQAGQDLSTEFAVRQIPTDAAPFGAYSSLKDIQAVLASASCGPVAVPGCRGIVTSTQTIYQNEPVVTGMLSSLGAYRTSAGPAFQIPYGYVAISVSFTSINSVVNSISPGDDVDLIASNTGGTTTGGGEGLGAHVPAQTQYVLNDVRVIGVGGPPAQPPPPPTPTPAVGIHNSSAPAPTPVPAPTAASGVGGGTLVLLVRYQEALVVQHLKDFSGTWTMSAVLRSAKETDIPHFKTLPVTARWFFTKQANHFDLTNPY